MSKIQEDNEHARLVRNVKTHANGHEERQGKHDALGTQIFDMGKDSSLDVPCQDSFENREQKRVRHLPLKRCMELKKKNQPVANKL